MGDSFDPTGVSIWVLAPGGGGWAIGSVIGVQFVVRVLQGGSVAEWLACSTQAQKGLGSNRSRDAVG